MKKYFEKIFLWFIGVWYKIIISLSLVLYRSEDDIFRTKPDNINEKNKYNIRMQHRNSFIEMILSGIRQEKIIKDYYEILKKADKFMRNSTPEQIEMSATKWGLNNYGKTDDEVKNIGKVAKRIQRDKDGKIIKSKDDKSKSKTRKDKFGRRYEHYGFFDPKSRNYGKTLGDVIRNEITERVTTDDTYPIEFMFTNKSVENGIAKVNEIVETKTDKSNTGFESMNEYEKALNKKYPLKVIRENETAINKIEQLTEFLHVKQINSKHRVLEFFIPAKYKTFELSEESDIFVELINIKQVWINDEYGELYGFKIKNFRKRILQKIEITENNEKIEKPIFEVIKLNGEKIEKI